MSASTAPLSNFLFAQCTDEGRTHLSFVDVNVQIGMESTIKLRNNLNQVIERHLERIKMENVQLRDQITELKGPDNDS